jgi:5-methylcytosine-specific restriction endonuclease McrA
MKRWTDEQLRDAVAQSSCVSHVLRLLALRPLGGNYATIRAHILRLDLDTSHWGRSKWRIVDREALEVAVRESDSIASAIARIGWPANTDTRRRFRALVSLYGLDTGHFLGQASHRGKRYPERVRPASYYLELNGPPISSYDLKRKLLAEGIFDPECATCGNTTWQGCPIPLELEHKNGNRYDNRSENLELLCSNCHALTPTYRGRNVRRRRQRRILMAEPE